MVQESSILSIRIGSVYVCSVLTLNFENSLIQKSNRREKSFFDLYTDGKKFDTIIQPKGAFRHPSKKEIKNKKIFETSKKEV